MPVLLQNRQRAVAVSRAWLERTAEAVLAAAGAQSAELSLALVSDRRMRSLNQRYRKKDRTTDVLAFPLLGYPLTLTLSLTRCNQGATGTPGRGEEKRRVRVLRKSTEVSNIPPPTEGEGQGEGDSLRMPMLLGDVVISMETAKRQASEFGHSLRDEVSRLLVHGVLHLLGYDHERSERDAALMARKEKAMLKAISGQLRS